MYMFLKGNLTKLWKNICQRLFRYIANSSDSCGYFFKNCKTQGEYCHPLVAFSLGSCYRHYLGEHGPLVKVGDTFGAFERMAEALYVLPDWGLAELTANVEIKYSTSIFRRIAKLATQLTPKPPKPAELWVFIKSSSPSSLMNFIFQANFICPDFQW